MTTKMVAFSNLNEDSIKETRESSKVCIQKSVRAEKIEPRNCMSQLVLECKTGGIIMTYKLLWEQSQLQGLTSYYRMIQNMGTRLQTEHPTEKEMS